MRNPEMDEKLKPYEAEYSAAAMRGDMAECRRIVEKAGFIWIEDRREKIGQNLSSQILGAAQDN